MGNDIRPIAVGEVFLRLTSKCLCATNRGLFARVELKKSFTHCAHVLMIIGLIINNIYILSLV